MNQQEKFNKAWELKKQGKCSDALKLYNELYGRLIKDANKYARSFEGSVIDKGNTRKLMPQLFRKTDEYLKRDNLACAILNNMGVIYEELGDRDTAKKYFEESIRLTPDNLNYPNPKIGLEELSK
ncbi:MAG: tetratricopeptide repeat protein [Patescibacteria group bacterium]